MEGGIIPGANPQYYYLDYFISILLTTTSCSELSVSCTSSCTYIFSFPRQAKQVNTERDNVVWLIIMLSKISFIPPNNVSFKKLVRNQVIKLIMMAKNKSVFINREQIKELVISVGTEQWKSFSASDLHMVGNAFRCNISADDKKAMLNIYFNNDGTTTILPTGANIDISTKIKVLLEQGCAFVNTSEAKTFSTKNVPLDWVVKLIEYLSSLSDVAVEQKEIEENPQHSYYQFVSKMGDKLTVNVYKTGTLTLQGKPAYLYGEAISLLSYCESVSVDDIVATVNCFHNIDIKTSEVRRELEALLPRSYGNIDDMVIKLLSPSISLRKVKIPLEDYSCYAFPALRALEGYIKYLFSKKTVSIGYNFGGIFDKGLLTTHIATKIADFKYQTELERLFAYLVGNRHVIFHTEQVLIGTTVLEDKHEADGIVNSVLSLIETSFTNLNT